MTVLSEPPGGGGEAVPSKRRGAQPAAMMETSKDPKGRPFQKGAVISWTGLQDTSPSALRCPIPLGPGLCADTGTQQGRQLLPGILDMGPAKPGPHPDRQMLHQGPQPHPLMQAFPLRGSGMTQRLCGCLREAAPKTWCPRPQVVTGPLSPQRPPPSPRRSGQMSTRAGCEVTAAR